MLAAQLLKPYFDDILVMHYASVGLSVWHSNEPYKNGWTDQDAVWVDDAGGPGEPCINRLVFRSPMGRAQFWGHKGRPTVSRI